MNLVLDLLWFAVILIYSYAESLVKLFIPVKRKSVSGEIVLITGAGQGIGRLTSYEFAKRHSTLILWDINKRGVEETAEGCRKLGANAHAFVVDCSIREEIYRAAEKVKKDIGDVSILVNNAGVLTTADLLSTQDKQIQKTFEVNILAHYWTTKMFLPAMMKTNHGHIVTVASLAGYVTIPFMIAYSSSKFAAVGFHKALTEELAALGKHGINTTCLCPYFINNNFVKNLSTRLVPVVKLETVVAQLMDGILCNQKNGYCSTNYEIPFANGKNPARSCIEGFL
ncbi:hypothetical protein JRQ81_016917 [Phrynocephalus forsythii]|uniref:Estradiol 17-beta-dehydrogenase 11 n=1 Tax=Phrynocephalus forsythii TaxID=171643 RepID=A0A9Q1B1D2_9SAUR|nr:hypothetical protein JRQ81_016917 [Phrynocephalus forsythii]